MKRVSSAYKEAMNKDIREQGFISVVLAEVNGIAQQRAEFVTQGAYWSNNQIPFENDSSLVKYATFENGYTRADGNSLIMPREGETYLLNTGFTTQNFMQEIQISFGAAYDIKGLTIDFGECYPTEFRVATDVNPTGTVYTNDSPNFSTPDTLGNISTLTITPISMLYGNKRLRINHILMGIGLAYSNDDVESAELTEENSPISAELPSTQFTVTILDEDNKYDINNPDSFINFLTGGQTVSVAYGITLEDESIEWVQAQTLMLSDWSSKNGKFSFTATDMFVDLNGEYSLGNRIYTRTAYAEFESILQDAGLEPGDYEIDNYLRDITLTNPMPVDTHANCLKLLCNATRCVFYQDRTGLVRIVGNFALNIQPENIDVHTDSATDYSVVNNIKTNGAVQTHYADFTDKFTVANGEFMLLPKNVADYDENTGFVSKHIADDNGIYFDNLLPTPYGGTRTQAGVKFTYNADGSVHAKGTCTADTWYYLHSNGGLNPWMASDCPWAVDDVLQVDYFIKGSITGYIGISWGYKIGSSGANQGYIVNRSNQYFEMTDTKVKLSDIKRQTINPEDRAGQYLTGYIYVKKGCVIDATIYPMLTKRQHVNNIIDGYNYSFMRHGNKNIYENNGIIYKLNDDGSILVNGTASSESACVIVNPYDSNGRKILTSGHTYTLSEGREISGVHDTFLQFVRYNSNTSSFDYTINTKNNSSNSFTASDSNLLGYGIRIIVPSGKTADNVLLKPTLIDVNDYDATEYQPTRYQMGYKPKLVLELPAAFTYYGLNMRFANEPPKDVTITTFNNDNMLDTYNFTNLQKEALLSAEFLTFDKMEIVFNKSTPITRVAIDYIGLGNLTDYFLSKGDMLSHLIGSKEDKIQDIKVKIYSYELDENNEPREIEDDVWYTHTINTEGRHIEVTNPLIHTSAQAQTLAEWIGFYYDNNAVYECDYRGDPRLNAMDIIKVEDDYLNNLQTEIIKATLTFNGGFKGELTMRKAVNEQT